MLQQVIKKKKGEPSMANQTIDTLEKLLISNGIVSVKYHNQQNYYEFPYLYKYRLGLTGETRTKNAN